MRSMRVASLTMVIFLAALFFASPCLATDAKPVGLVGSSYGRHDVKWLSKQAMTTADGKAIPFKKLGESLPIKELGQYRLIIICTAIKAPLTAEEAAAVKAYVEGGGHILFLQASPRSMLGAATLAKTDWLGIKHVSWHRGGMKCAVLKADHELLKGVLDKNATPTWLMGSSLAAINAPDFENIIGTEKGDCLLGMRTVGKGWIAYLGHEYFRLLPKKSGNSEDAPAYLAIIRNIIQKSGAPAAKE
jgi:hypothetical protein